MKKLIVSAKNQEATLWDESVSPPQVLKKYKVSTAKNGLGSVKDSYCTPLGKMSVAEKIGAGAAHGSIFKGRKFTGEIWSGLSPQSQEDLILTRILWLKGLEPVNANTYERFIYLHGTNHENTLGTANSHGCIRFSNLDIIELFDLLNVGSEVIVET